MDIRNTKKKNILYTNWGRALFLLFWLLIVLLSLFWNIGNFKEHSMHMAREDARVMFSFIETVRLWNARHGGVYVAVTPETPPNPYLEVPDRDIVDQKGRTYTLVNPAYMTRQIAELARAEKNIYFHITSLNPIRPENAADEWEVSALQSFEKGKTEVMEKVVWSGESMYRYMSALKVRKACLQCHRKQGYKEGDVRGGISVSFSAETIDASLRTEIKNIFLLHLVVYLLVSTVCLLALGRGRKHWEEMTMVQAMQEKTIAERTKELVLANSRLKEEIEERKEAENILRESEKRYRSVTQSAHDAIISTDEWGKIVGWNNAASKIFGYTEAEVLGQSILLLVPGKLQPIYLERFRSFRNHDVPWTTGEIIEAKGKKKGGEVIPVEISISRWSSQGSILYTGIVRDISERKRMEKDLRALNRTLEERVMVEIAKRREQEQLLLQKSKLMAMGEMIGSIAHQWRQPLNSISLIIQDIRESFRYGDLTEKEIDTVTEDAMKQVQFMSGTIDDFRNFFNPSKERTSFDAVAGVHDALSILDAQLRSHGIEVTVNAEESFLINGYQNEYKQALLNILSNALYAVKTSREKGSLGKGAGGIVITFSRLSDGGVSLEVYNDGEPIPDDFIGLIFNPYVSSKPESEGSGIGLYMTKIIIESNMKGTIQVENRERGVAFILYFPPLEGEEKKERDKAT